MVRSAAVDEFEHKGFGLVGVAAADLQHIVLSQAHGREPHILGNGRVLKPEDLAELDLVDRALDANQQNALLLVQGDGDTMVALPVPRRSSFPGTPLLRSGGK